MASPTPQSADGFVLELNALPISVFHPWTTTSTGSSMPAAPLIDSYSALRAPRKLKLSKCDRRNYYHVSESSWVLTSSALAGLRDRLQDLLHNRLEPGQAIVTYALESAFLGVVSVRFARDYAQSDSARRAQLWIDLFEDNHELQEELIDRIPHLMGIFLRYKHLSASVVEWLEDMYERYKFGISFMAPTPMEAARIHKARGVVPPPLTSRSHVRLNFYTNPEDGKYYASRNTQPKEPEAWIDLPLDLKTGVDLTVARKAWGLESLAVLTKSRTVFSPSNEDTLSPLAAYDLSNNFKQPLRVFEPVISPSTLRIRKIRNATFPTYIFLITLIPLLVGFPTQDTVPIKAIIGEDYERKYIAAGRATRGLRQWLVRSLPVILFTLLAWSINFGVQLGRWLVTSLDASFSLQTRLSENCGYVIAFALVWFVLAEVVANLHTASE